MSVPNLTNSMGVDLLEFRDALSSHLERWRVVRAMVDGKHHISFEVPAFYCQSFNSDKELSAWLCQQARSYADESKSQIGDGTYV